MLDYVLMDGLPKRKVHLVDVNNILNSFKLWAQLMRRRAGQKSRISID